MSNNKPCDTLGCAAEVPEGVKNCDRHLCYALKEPAPSGWRMVPIIPTAEMLSAVSEGANDRALADSRSVHVWETMLGAVPVYPDEVVISIAAPYDNPLEELERALSRSQRFESEPAPASAAQAVAEYLANVKGNLRPKEICPHCGGSEAPYDQVDCVDIPCPIGRDYHRPPLEEVTKRVEALLGIA